MMQLVKTLSVGILATFLWNCNDATQPESKAAPDARIPATINALVKTAANSAGLVPESTVPAPQPTLPFSTEALAALKDAGLCQGFIDLFEELTSSSQTLQSGVFTPRLQEVITCLGQKAELDPESIETDLMGIVDECFCKGTGTVFGNFTFKLAKYAAPTVGGSYSAPVSTSAPYAAPVSTGTPYSAPTSAAGEGYSAPGL